ncbi:MAG: FAD-dependent oxidoreductase [Synechococcaceae cyanobacterium]
MTGAGGEPVLVLGGGLMGLATAHALARRGQPVLVLSRRRSEAAGFVAAGMLAPHAEGLEGVMLDLGRRSLERIPAWVAGIEADAGLSCGLWRCGIVVPFGTAGERDAFPTARHGIALDRRGLEQEVAGIGPRWRAGVLFPQDGQIDNRRRLMRALERACTALGVRFHEGSEVLALDTAAGRLAGVWTRTVEGQQQLIASRRAVLSCGAWSARLLPDLPVVPIKGQMLSLQGPREALRRVVFGPGTYLVPRRDGLLVVGATSEPEARFDGGLTPQGQRQLQEGIEALLPEAAHWPPMERWWGFRPGTPDQAPLLGPSAIEGLWLATGHYRNGVLLAAITAEVIARQLAGAEPDARMRELLQAFRWERFHRDGARANAQSADG